MVSRALAQPRRDMGVLVGVVYIEFRLSAKLVFYHPLCHML